MRPKKRHTPFRYQLSEFDCVPTTITNAISYLYDRHEIPPEVLQRIHLYTLDGVGRRGTSGRGGSTRGGGNKGGGGTGGGGGAG